MPSFQPNNAPAATEKSTWGTQCHGQDRVDDDKNHRSQAALFGHERGHTGHVPSAPMLQDQYDNAPNAPSTATPLRMAFQGR